jgi:hypothetical protein
MSGNGDLRISEASLADSEGRRQFSKPPEACQKALGNQRLVAKRQSECDVTWPKLDVAYGKHRLSKLVVGKGDCRTAAVPRRGVGLKRPKLGVPVEASGTGEAPTAKWRRRLFGDRKSPSSPEDEGLHPIVSAFVGEVAPAAADRRRVSGLAERRTESIPAGVLVSSEREAGEADAEHEPQTIVRALLDPLNVTVPPSIFYQEWVVSLVR